MTFINLHFSNVKISIMPACEATIDFWDLLPRGHEGKGRRAPGRFCQDAVPRTQPTARQDALQPEAAEYFQDDSGVERRQEGKLSFRSEDS